MEKKRRTTGKREPRTEQKSGFKQIDSAELSKVKTAFGVDNGKQMDTEDTVKYFVPLPEFFRLFVAKNQILLGSRGSGKTTWVRMLAHDHVVLAAKEGGQRADYAREALRKNLIGIYVPASAAFAGDLKNKPWQTEAEAERYFVWRLNLHICSALTHILSSCIDQYSQQSQNRATIQSEICTMLAAAWTDNARTCSNVQELRLVLSELELKHQTEIRRRRNSSSAVAVYEDHFDSELLLPLRHSINIIRSKLAVPDGAVWMICLDEVEYLSELHHRILNTQMRSSNSDIVFKIATMPFAHHTLATNFGDPVREGNDFEYINVDRESIDSRGGQAEGEFLVFARAMFKRRMSFRAPQLAELTLRSLLGPSPLIDEKKVESLEEREAFLSLLKRHANFLTVARAERLEGSPKFKSEIVRKMHGALLLRDAISHLHGNTKLRIYCGEATVVRCCDGNARRLMRVVNQLVQRIKIDHLGKAILPLDAGVQNQILESLARDTLNRVHSEPPNGALAGRYLEAIGRFMKWQFSSSNRLMGTDQVTSVTISADDGKEAQLFIKQAVQLSLMIPAKDVTLTASDRDCTGVFHIAFLFAPLFHLLPRRNDSVRLSRILSHSAKQQNIIDPDQQTFFEAP